MYNIDELIEASYNSHFKLLVLIGDNESKKQEIINYLENDNWHKYDIEQVVLDLTNDIPAEKTHLRIGQKIKDWVKTLEKKVIFYNTNILFSPELKQVKPTQLFSYLMRGNKQGILFLDARLKEDQAIYSTPDKKDFCKMDLNQVVYADINNVTIKEDY